AVHHAWDLPQCVNRASRLVAQAPVIVLAALPPGAPLRLRGGVHLQEERTGVGVLLAEQVDDVPLDVAVEVVLPGRRFSDIVRHTAAEAVAPLIDVEV